MKNPVERAYIHSDVRDPQPSFETAADALEHVDSSDLPAAVAALVRCALLELRSERWGAFTIGDTRAVALLYLANELSGDERDRVLAWAAEHAEDGRVLAAIAGRMKPSLRATAVRDSIASFRAAERIDHGAAVHLVTLAGLCEEQEALLLAEAAAAGLSRPTMLGDLARGQVEIFWPHFATPIPPTSAAALWAQTNDWEVLPRLHLRARLAPRLPAAERASAIEASLDEIREMTEADEEPLAVATDLVVLAPHLDLAAIEVAVALLPRLASPAAVEAIALRQLELGESIEDTLALLDRVGQSYTYWPTVARALAARENSVLAAALGDHLETLGDKKASWFIEEHAASLTRGLDSRRLFAIIAPMAPAENLLSRASLAPHLPQRDDMLTEALATGFTLNPYGANLHAFIPCAQWLPEVGARKVLATLLGLHSRLGGLLVGDEGSPNEYPGIAQLVPLLNRLGGAATLEAVARVVASTTSP